MGLMIEDGSGVAGANSYVALDEARAFALDRGRAMPDDDARAGALLIQAGDYVDTYDFMGYRRSSDQSMAWPRSGIVVGGQSIDSGSIPLGVKRAQMLLALEAMDGNLVVSRRDGSIKREKVDVIETEYFEPTASITALSRSRYPVVEALLSPWLASGLPGLSKWTDRL